MENEWKQIVAVTVVFFSGTTLVTTPADDDWDDEKQVRNKCSRGDPHFFFIIASFLLELYLFDVRVKLSEHW